MSTIELRHCVRCGAPTDWDPSLGVPLCQRCWDAAIDHDQYEPVKDQRGYRETDLYQQHYKEQRA